MAVKSIDCVREWGEKADEMSVDMDNEAHEERHYGTRINPTE